MNTPLRGISVISSPLAISFCTSSYITGTKVATSVENVPSIGLITVSIAYLFAVDTASVFPMRLPKSISISRLELWPKVIRLTASAICLLLSSLSNSSWASISSSDRPFARRDSRRAVCLRVSPSRQRSSNCAPGCGEPRRAHTVRSSCVPMFLKNANNFSLVENIL